MANKQKHHHNHILVFLPQTSTNAQKMFAEKELFALINLEAMSVLVLLDSKETLLLNRDVSTSTNVSRDLIWRDILSVAQDPIVSTLLDPFSVTVLTDTLEIPRLPVK